MEAMPALLNCKQNIQNFTRMQYKSYVSKVLMVQNDPSQSIVILSYHWVSITDKLMCKQHFNGIAGLGDTFNF